MGERNGGCGRLFAAILVCVAWAAPATADEPVTYTLGSEQTVRNLYPDASWLPKAYRDDYTNLAWTIEHYTEQSLRRDGVADPDVRVTLEGSGDDKSVRVRITPVTATTKRYKKVHPAFLDSAHAGQARKGVAGCKGASGCWDRKPRKGQPWALLLPLGLPMVTQNTVLFLDYPPIPALTGRDYLNNYTMCRWGRVMGAAGAESPVTYETIVDSRPIAAPGSGESQYLPDPIQWFNTESKDSGYYITPMLELLAAPRQSSGGYRPVAVFGSAARKAWGRIAGTKHVGVLDYGTAKVGKQKHGIPWIATNHPDVTTYQDCDSKPGIVKDEQKDFVAACWLIEMANDAGLTPKQAKQKCTSRWMDSPKATDRQALCVQAKLDTNDQDAVCGSYTEAWRYCSAHDGNPCVTRDCDYDRDKAKDPPPPDQRPAGWEQTCNHYR